MKIQLSNCSSIFWFALILMMAAGCTNRETLPDLPKGVQAISQMGDTLKTPEMHPNIEEEFANNLETAMQSYRLDPEDSNSLIWLGRRTAYMGEYREAITIFTEGIFKHPEDPRFFRHRGHRYVTLREFDLAIEDFETAASLMKNRRDEIEPDGLPNPQNIPTSTIKSNIWYHLGLAHYVKGDFEKASDAYQQALQLDLTDDMRIATLYWYYMALKRAGNDEQAGIVISGVESGLELLENEIYYQLLLVFNGIFDPEKLVESGMDDLENSTLLYGIGNWHYINGRQERALRFWRDVYEKGQWPSFGYIAAEAELARLNSEELSLSNE